MTIEEILIDHFPNTCSNVIPIDDKGLRVIIAIPSNDYNPEHFWYKWDTYMAELEPSLHGGSWECVRSTSDGYDTFDFNINFPI